MDELGVNFNSAFSPYGHGNNSNSPIIALGESWAYHMGHFLTSRKDGAASGGFDEQNFVMVAGENAALVTIPAYYARKSVCDKIAPFVGKGLVITVKTPEDTNDGPDSLDGDFDNGIITHEYGHGVSNRLTGGPAQANCLSNAEQMGEGWSDFMSLIMTAKPGDKPEQVRGIGNFATSAPIDGIGIRRRPFTTTMSIN